MENCSPLGLHNHNSCIPEHLLRNISKLINKYYKYPFDESSDLRNQIKIFLKNELGFDSEIDLLKNKNKITKNLNRSDLLELKSYFKPFAPKSWKDDPETWLDTTNIDNVLKSYSKKYKHFKYYGAIPIDFDKKKNKECMVSDLCKIDCNELKKKYKSVGIVFNTDPHNKGGVHWFSMYIDLVGINRKGIPTLYYYDPAKHKIKKEIKSLITKIKKQMDNIDIIYNDVQHQKGDSECGTFCIYFIVEMLKGKNFEDYINNKMMNDKEMNNFRKNFFIIE